MQAPPRQATTHDQFGGNAVTIQPMVAPDPGSHRRDPSSAGVMGAALPGPAEPSPTTQPPHTGGTVLDRADDLVDEWGRQSFPASDPPSNW